MLCAYVHNDYNELTLLFIEYFNQFKYTHIDNVRHRSSTIR